MATFGEMLKEAISAQNLTTYGIAKQSGVDRSFLHGVFKGTKKLPYKRFNEVINTSFFSTTQVAELCDKYFEEKYGLDKVNRLKYINQAIEDGCDDENYEDIEYPRIEVIPNKLYTGRDIVLSLIYTILNDGARRLSTNFSFSDYEINSIVYNICRKNNLDSFFHFVYKYPNRTDNYNLEIVFNSLHYAEIGYLTHVTDENEIPGFLPHFILTDRYFIKYDAEAQNAYVMNSPDIIEYVEQYIKSNMRHYTPEVQITKTALDSMYAIQGIASVSDHSVVIGFDSETCATYLNLEMANSIATPFIKENPGIIQGLFAHYNFMLNSGVEDAPQELGYILTHGALVDFAETGRFGAFPSDYATGLSKKYRADYLEMMINDSKSQFKLTNPAFLSTNYSCSYQINDSHLIICSCKDINKDGEYSGRVIYITDDVQTVADFYDYYRYISINEKTYSVEKTKQIIQSAINSLRASEE